MFYMVVDRHARSPEEHLFFSSYSAMEQFVRDTATKLLEGGFNADWCRVYAYEQDGDQFKRVFKYKLNAGLGLTRSC